MWSVVDDVAANGRDELAVDGGSAGAAERVVRRDAEQERSAAVLDVDDEAGRRIVDCVWRRYVSFSAVKDDRVILEVQR